MSALDFFAGFLLGLVVRFFARLLAPTISVSTVNGVTLATVTSVFGKDEYTRTDRHQRNEIADDHRVWLHIRSGTRLDTRTSIRCDALVSIEECLKPLREVEA